jgi:hypothetical protein
MKNILIILLLLATIILSYFLLKDDCDSCKRELNSSQIVKDDFDLTLKFDCKINKYQPLHLDMLNSYGIMARPTIINDSVKLEFMIQEVGTCKRYYIENFQSDTDRTTNDLKVFNFQVNKIKSTTTSANRMNTAMLAMSEGSPTFDVDIHIKSDDPDLLSPKDKDSNFVIDKLDPSGIKTYYPPQWCIARVSNGTIAQKEIGIDSLTVTEE